MVVRFLLSPELPTLDQWCEEFGVSRPSIVKDIKAVKEWLAERRLALVGKSGVGYSLVAREFDLRNAVVQYLVQGNEVKLADPAAWRDGRPVLGDFDFAPVRRFLDELQRDAKAELIESDYVALALYVAITVVRLRDGRRVPDDLGDLQSLLGTSEHKLVTRHVRSVEKACGVKLSPAEATHLTLNFICAKKLQPRPVTDAAPGGEAERLANEVAHDAEEVFGVPLAKDEDFLRLLATHIGVTLRKLRFGLPLEPEGPTEEIKRQHPLAFGVGLMFTERLSQRLGRKVPVLEGTYVAMHVAAGLEKVKYRLQRRKRVALVCTTALSASTLLFWQLTNLLPQVDVVQVGTYEDVVKGRMTSQVDLIVSTVALPPVDAPVVVISPLFTADDRRRILAAIQAKPERDLIHRTAVQLLTPETTLLNRTYADSRRLLAEVGRFLVQRGYAKRGFVKALLKREAQFGSALNMPVPLAMPHAGPTYTRKTAVALVTLKQAIPFKLVEDPARELRVRLVIIPLLALDDVTGMRFYELLAAIRRKKLGRAIVEAAKPEEVIGLVAGSLGGHAGKDGATAKDGR
jgi:mannitol/fructose-specific phosphotransferase system IIA component (Ntr-type)